TSEPTKARAIAAPSRLNSGQAALSRTPRKARPAKARAVRKCVRKKRGLRMAGGSSNRQPIIPAARRREKTASMSSPRAVDQGHQLVARGLVVAEDAAHGAGGADAAGLAHAADGHAGVRGFEDDADAAWFEFLHQEVGQLLRHAFLHLRPVGQHLDD